MKILHVEDSQADAIAVRRFLEQWDSALEVVSMAGGEQAIQWLRDCSYPEGQTRCPVDLILVDLNLHGMSGLEFVAQLREDGSLGAVPIVVLSSSNDKVTVRQAYEAGANAYLAKPECMDQYRALLQAMGEFWCCWAHVPGPDNGLSWASGDSREFRGRQFEEGERNGEEGCVHVLVVDDMMADAVAIKRYLRAIEGRTFDIQIADNTTDADAMVKHEKKDVIILDYKLQGSSGMTFLENLRKEGFQGGIIMLTGQGDERIAARAMRLGADDYVVKDEVSALVLQTSMEYVWQRIEKRDEGNLDEVTRLLNRRAFGLQLAEKVRRACRAQTHLALVVVDIDRFKVVNDDYGHVIGDAVLKKVADVLSASVRSDDLVARYGGDELCLVIQGCPLEETVKVVERMRNGVANASCPIDDQQTVQVTCSAGISMAQWRDWYERFRLFERADQAMYAAKGTGGNQVKVYEGA